VVVSRHQSEGQNHSVLTANKSFENVAKFKYWGTRVTNQNCSHENRIRGKLATILFSLILCVSSLKTKGMLFCMGVKLGLSH